MELELIPTQTVDVTFLPGFKSTGDKYKDSVRILEEWNGKLREVAREWSHGTVYDFDSNAFIIDRIRDWQLHAAGIEEDNDLGKNLDLGWENVVEPCVEGGFQVMMSKDKKQTKCIWVSQLTGSHGGNQSTMGLILLNPKGAPWKRHNRRGFAA
ncbi:hypothetical protein PEX2_008230 [Penicillium expansum]|uniref:Uncharacterized protein n=1 Tax=Penicillium expansum TaxID=27334 RepID=A0A0A2JA97_PENEN|nr:hypothetical protein PEX2_008230 [Penicillium expansum]KGO51706.1 hypothetical protein PEX2_008230 [Penicillium expansum]